MKTWVISYRYRRGGEVHVAEVHSIAGMLWWVWKEAASCVVITIARMEEKHGAE